ncbi:MAG: hypothetical protein JXA66_00415 [Oligoflexia bacterium]|nr:hypothetical protein [Oligoflexia bacterium]
MSGTEINNNDNVKGKKGSKIRDLEGQLRKLKEENVKYRIIINEFKKKVASLEAERKTRLLQEGNEAPSLKESGMKELQKIISSSNPEMEIAGLIGEREFFRERIREAESRAKQKDKEVLKITEQLHQKEADLALLENTVNSMGSERERLYLEFDAERKAMEESFSQKEEQIKKAFVAFQLAKRKFLNEKNMVQMRLDEINRRYIEREKQLRVLSTALKLKEQELMKDYFEKEKKISDQLEAMKKETAILEGRLSNSQKELRDALIKLQEYEDDYGDS